MKRFAATVLAVSAIVVGVLLVRSGGENPTTARRHLTTMVVASFAPQRAEDASAFVAHDATLAFAKGSWTSMDYNRHEMLVQWCVEADARSNAHAIAAKLGAGDLFQKVSVQKRLADGMGNC